MATENPTQSTLEAQNCSAEEVKNVKEANASLVNENPISTADKTGNDECKNGDACVEVLAELTDISQQLDDSNCDVEVSEDKPLEPANNECALEKSKNEIVATETVESASESAEECGIEKAITTEVVDTLELTESSSDNAQTPIKAIPTESISGEKAFEGATKESIITIFGAMLNERAIHTLRRDVESAKMAFNKLHREDIEVARTAFIEAGGVEEEFVPAVDSFEIQFKELIKEYRRLRDEYLSNLDAAKEENLKIKLQIIEELKELINSDETLNLTFTKFRDLQQSWKDTGLVPQQSMKDLWETYNHHVENFYGFIKINKELRDLDLKKNFEQKSMLCQQAESLLLESSILDVFVKLQKLHDEWRETGPVSNEFKETLWSRFKEASSRINKAHQEHFDGLKEDQTKNLDLKSELCLLAEGFHTQSYTTRKEWNKVSDELLEIQKTWKTIGFAPKKDNNRIYERFRTACDKFFEAKREFYAGVKGDMDNNLELKIELCTLAESMAGSEDWKKTTDELIALQTKWKEIGAVSRRHSDQIWKRFRAACDLFFEKKSSHFSNVDGEYEANLEKKKALLEEMSAVDIKDGGYDAIKELQRRWSEIGFVPIKQKDAIHKQYKEIADKLFATLRGSDRERSDNNFRDRVSSMKDSGDKKLRSERERLYNKVRQLEQDIALLENNIGFFAKSKNADALIADVQSKIERTKEEMAKAISRVKLIDSE